MTIDEAIKHCHEVATGALCEGTVNHKACGEEHKQLAEWLEELKRTREQLKSNAIHSAEQNNDFGYEKENTTEDLGTHTCSKCELHLEDFTQQIYDEDEDETSSVEFEFLYCPGCGRKVENYYGD